MPSPAPISVVYLVSRSLGEHHLIEFLASYEEHRSESTHELVLLFNGFTEDEAARQHDAASLSARATIRVIGEPVQDIEAYRRHATGTAFDRYCFLNSYSRILADSWLAHLDDALRPGVGVAGATASWETHGPTPDDPHPDHGVRGGHRIAARARTRASMLKHRLDFPAFPNAHIRTTAFLVRRQDFLTHLPRPVSTKDDAYRFESGHRGLTAGILRAGADALVVDRHGQTFSPQSWPDGRTFRSHQQENLLVADNRTVQYDESPADLRRALARRAWGDRARVDG